MKFGKKLKIVSKKFDSEPVYNEKDLKAKIKSFNGKVAVKESMNFLSRGCSKQHTRLRLRVWRTEDLMCV